VLDSKVVDDEDSLTSHTLHIPGQRCADGREGNHEFHLGTWAGSERW
jgi:hypothetical protein